MKKFLISLILLLIAASVAFYFGWIQFLIPDDGHAVVFSRTSGWEDEVVEPGTFQWRWERLLPTNMSLYIYHIESQSLEISVEGTLPSGEVYRTILEDRPDFSYRISGRVNFRIRPDELPLLSQENGLRPDTIDDFHDELSERIISEAQGFITRQIIENEPVLPPGVLSDALLEHLTTRFPGLDIATVTLRSVEVPDFALYAEARSLYLALAEADRDAVASLAQERALRRDRSEQMQQALRSYGELLTEFPVLLEYFELGIDPLRIQELVPDLLMESP
ncbi:MAG: hypothetical protein EA383_04155 [Spirochaetaceae bacterium]|nr:MAG: hypothetical protein EA383_04155 [Spirochaetaceae bacterium]